MVYERLDENLMAVDPTGTIYLVFGSMVSSYATACIRLVSARATNQDLEPCKNGKDEFLRGLREGVDRINPLLRGHNPPLPELPIEGQALDDLVLQVVFSALKSIDHR